MPDVTSTPPCQTWKSPVAPAHELTTPALDAGRETAGLVRKLMIASWPSVVRVMRIDFDSAPRVAVTVTYWIVLSKLPPGAMKLPVVSVLESPDRLRLTPPVDPTWTPDEG